MHDRAAQLAAKAPLARRALKEHYVVAERLSFADFIALETERHRAISSSKDCREASESLQYAGIRFCQEIDPDFGLIFESLFRAEQSPSIATGGNASCRGSAWKHEGFESLAAGAVTP